MRGRCSILLSVQQYEAVHACLRQIAVKCLNLLVPSESCTGQDLADLGDRLRDWFQLLHGNAKQNNSGKLGAGTASGRGLKKQLCVSCLCKEKQDKQKETKVKVSNFCPTALDKSLVASCKDSIGWMFSRLDTNSDLYLDQAELAAINLDKYEVCIRPFFNSCDSYRDGKVSTAEWCLCFWRESEYPGQALWGLCSVRTETFITCCVC